MNKEMLAKVLSLNERLVALREKKETIANSKNVVGMIKNGNYFSPRDKYEHILAFLVKDDTLLRVFDEAYNIALEKYSDMVDSEIVDIEKEIEEI